MAEKEFVHLHLHTQYSLLDGANKIPDVLQAAKNLGQPAIAITDHGNLHGVVDFYQAAKKIEIKALIGCELYVTPGSRFERKSRVQGGAGTYHLTVIAENQKGYANLCKLVTLAYREGFYFKPRVDHEILSEYSSGLIVLSGCLNSEMSECAIRDDEKQARKLLEYFTKHFDNRFFLEIQPHNVPEQQKLNELCAFYAKNMGIPLVATNDCHYQTKDDHYAQEVLMCISTGKRITDPDRMRYDGVLLHLKTYDEMVSGFQGSLYAKEALENTVKIAERCNVEFDFSRHFMPVFISEDPRPLIDIMAAQARQGLANRLETMKSISNLSEKIIKQYNDRLEEEIRLIDQMGFAGYFLVVSDFIVWAKENGVPVGPGRGSVAGSLVAFSMRITEIDPIKHKLIFERFLNPERVSLPDIDVDFCIYGRDKAIRYVVEKYGKDRVAQIATFGTLKAKAAIKDVGRVLGKSYAEMDRIGQLVPAPRQGFDYALPDALKMEPRLEEYARNEGKEVIELAIKLEGLTRHSSTHAAGVVIGDRPLDEMLPLMVDKDGNDVTQFSMGNVERIGLVKFDFLGLKTLSVINTALELIKKSCNVELHLGRIPLDDAKTFKLLCSGNTTGVFQLESGGITEMTMRLRPSSFDDLVAILALYRPGPLDSGMAEHYIERKHGREPVTYLHPRMKPVLEDTYGIMIYQEQIMHLARELAGYSLGQADILRKAMGKKNSEEMKKQRQHFIKGAKVRKIDDKLANEIFNQMETFARYGFNRSHSAAYAMISYQTAYLKAHYHVEFMAALMTHEMDDSDKILKDINECRRQHIEVIPPDVNVSFSAFSVSKNMIRYGLEAVKGIGEKAVEAIICERESHGDFQDLGDFISRVDLHSINRRVIENLIKCGAFDFSGVTRRHMLENLELILKANQTRTREIDSNQICLFSSVPQAKKKNDDWKRTILPEWPVNQRLAFEREALGFYISGHPLEKYQPELRRLGACTLEEINARSSQSTVRVAGVITQLKLKNTRKGDRYATFRLEDCFGTIECIVWPDLYRKASRLLAMEDPVLVTARIDKTDERCIIIAENIESLISARDKSATQGLISISDSDNLDSRLNPLLKVLNKYPGNCPVKVRMEVTGAEVFMVLRDQKDSPVCVRSSEDLCEEVEQLFGRPVLFFS